jgi:GAF domain-containing protein
MVPSEAISACLYDINTDELRFVALSGPGAAGLQGRAIPRASGLFSQAARLEHHASLFKDVFVEPAYDPDVDSRPGLDARNILLRPIVHEHQLLGMLQLINRRGKLEFTPDDAHLVSYVAERLAEFVHNVRRQRSQQPPPRK